MNYEIDSLDEIIIEKNFDEKNNIHVGDKIILKIDIEEDEYGNIYLKGTMK
jgi:hypothetical protein